jgi:hypothetical protein
MDKGEVFLMCLFFVLLLKGSTQTVAEDGIVASLVFVFPREI